MTSGTVSAPPHTQILPASAHALAAAAKLVRAGDVVALPTETVYGLAADATQPAAVHRIFACKGRPLSNPLIVHVGSETNTLSALMARGYVADLRDSPAQAAIAEHLMRHFWPGPLTLVLPRGPAIPAIVAAGMPTVGVRMPAHPVFLQLLDELRLPLAAPSANRANRVSPTSADAVYDELAGRIPLIIDGGPCAVGVESTIVQVLTTGALRLLRLGGLPVETIERAAGTLPEHLPATVKTSASPGRQRIHYAPQKPVVLCNAEEDPMRALARAGITPERLALLLMATTTPAAWQKTLSELATKSYALNDEGTGEAAAKQLYATLRAIDAGPCDAIVAEFPSNAEGFWPTIADRLKRAAAASEAKSCE